jgi:tetratricopeptide (TPR) repeat protein/DNA-binding CsgD family transcriptional regulator
MKVSVSGKFLSGGLAFIILCFNLITEASNEQRDSLQRELYLATRPGAKTILLNLLAESYAEDNPLKSHTFALQARSLAETEGNNIEKAKASYFIALHDYKLEKYSEAFNFMLEAQETFKNVDELKWYAKSCLELGKIYERKYNFEKALEALINASEIFKELADSVKLAETYNILGISYFDQKNYDKAFEYFQDALNIRIKLKDESDLASIYNNIGEIYRFKNENEKALKYFHKALLINLRLSRLLSVAINYDNLGNIYLMEGKYDSSLYFLEQSLSISKSHNYGELISQSSISLGRLYKKTDLPKIALPYFESAYQIANQHGYFLLMRDAAFELSEIYKGDEQYREAYNYYQVFKRVGDSLFNNKNQEKIAQLEMKLLFEQENKYRQLQKERTWLVYFVIAFGVVIILIVFVLIYGRLRIRLMHSKINQETLLLERAQLMKEIDFKNRELATNVMYLVKKNELINFISDKLLKAKSVFKKERQTLVQEIILELQSNIDINIWKTFEERFVAVHREFFERMNKNFPQLTENEKKLCALLRLNMSTKDIAAITHQSPNSIEVARTRLRKKLNISNTEVSLVSFLANI